MIKIFLGGYKNKKTLMFVINIKAFALVYRYVLESV